MRTFASFATAFLVASSLLACGDDGDSGGDASLAAVFPETGFAGRTTRVQITGENANWTAPTVSFGDGVTVSNIEILTPDSFLADVVVADTAAFGARTVTVTDGGSVMLTDSFTIESPVEVEIIGTLAQGSIAQLEIRNKDIDNPFDTSFTGDGFFEPLVFTGVELTGPDGVDLTTNLIDVSEYAITTIAVIDTTAAAGSFSIKSGLTMPTQVTSPGAALDIAPRTAMALTAGTPATGMIDVELGTALYEFAPGQSPMLSNLDVTTTTPDAAPQMIILGSSGSFTELLDITPSIFDGGGMLPSKIFVIVFENSGLAGYNYSLLANTRTFSQVNEAANETAAGAQAVTAPALITAKLTDIDDQDWYKITATAADVGKKIAVSTAPGDETTDTVVAMFRGNNGGTAFGSASSDQDWHESHTSPAIPEAGTYWIRITMSDFEQTIPLAMRDDYKAVITIE